MIRRPRKRRRCSRCRSDGHTAPSCPTPESTATVHLSADVAVSVCIRGDITALTGAERQAVCDLADLVRVMVSVSKPKDQPR